ncbi:replication initiation protein [uncultured Shewanella sp.]|uniref:replication initiation protein n=1 Tax=uncultured Shewanella sp. TaxID=173975 RepID=UPI0026361BCE|nr:replication initiation protein [uncultured Shewanella sp.]
MSENVITTAKMNQLHSDFFKKSHKLVFSQLNLSAIEYDIFALFLSRVNKRDWESYLKGEAEFPQYSFTNEVLSEWFDINKRELFSILKNPAARLSSKLIGIKDDADKKFIYRPLFKEVSYQKGVLTVIPNDRLIDEYLCISPAHAQIPHRTFRDLKRVNSKPLYGLLCRYKDPKLAGLPPQTLDDLYASFGLLDQTGKLAKKTFAVTGNLINKIIKPSIKEIDEKEPLISFHIDEKTGNYGFGYEKKGRKIVAIRFLFSWSVPKSIAREESDARKELESEVEAISSAKMTYELVNNFVIGDAGNPTMQELGCLMTKMTELKEIGYTFENDFMTNLTLALSEAKLIA